MTRQMAIAGKHNALTAGSRKPSIDFSLTLFALYFRPQSPSIDFPFMLFALYFRPQKYPQQLTGLNTPTTNINRFCAHAFCIIFQKQSANSSTRKISTENNQCSMTRTGGSGSSRHDFGKRVDYHSALGGLVCINLLQQCSLLLLLRSNNCRFCLCQFASTVFFVITIKI